MRGAFGPLEYISAHFLAITEDNRIKINYKTATTRYENSKTTIEIVSKKRICLLRYYFY